jgi:hypothetical protein
VLIAHLRRKQEQNHTWTIKRKAGYKMVQIGANVQCPECHKMGRIVWISQDKKLVGIQCPRRHSQIVRSHSRFGSNARPQTKLEKNMVFFMEIGRSFPASTER